MAYSFAVLCSPLWLMFEPSQVNPTHTKGGFSSNQRPPPSTPPQKNHHHLHPREKAQWKTVQLWPLKLATFLKNYLETLWRNLDSANKFNNMTPDYVIVSIKSCPEAGNDECLVLCNFVRFSMSSFEVTERTLWSFRSQEVRKRPVWIGLRAWNL